MGVLAAGDLVALLAFAVIGRASHGLTTLNWDALRTADPFIAGQFKCLENSMFL